jgi:hypothetical protein
VTRLAMTDRVARRLAIAGWALTIVVTASTLAILLISDAPSLPNRFALGDAATVAVGVLQLATATVAVLILVRLPRQRVGWLLMATGLLYALSMLAGRVAFAAAAEGRAGIAIAQWGGWFAFVTSTISGVTLFTIAFVFPDGRIASARLARLLPLLSASWFLWAFAHALQPGPMLLLTSLDNPLGVGPHLPAVLAPAGPVAIAGVGALLLAAGSVVWRFRRSRGVERQQMKWFAAAAVTMMVALGVTASAGFATSEGAVMEWPLVAYALAATAMPIAIGIAILRYRLYEIDRIISRTISYGVVTTLLVAVFAIVVVGLQTILTPFTSGQGLPVAASTLVVFALFQPLRRRVQSAIDRRFYRARYDAERTQAAFAARLRDNIDLESLAAEFRSVVGATVAPVSVGLWLRPAPTGDRR